MKPFAKYINMIKNRKLRKKVKDFIEELPVSNKYFKKYRRTDLKDAPAGPENFHHGYKGGLIEHTKSVTNLCIHIAKSLKETYPNIKINIDTLIASAILHDIMKVHTFYIGKNGVNHSGVLLDHGVWAAAELYKHDFPEDVIHCVSTHGGSEINPPLTIEAYILRYADLVDTEIDILMRQTMLKELMK